MKTDSNGSVKAALLILIVLTTVIGGVVVFYQALSEPQESPTAEPMDRDVLERLIHKEVNEKRVEHGLDPIASDSQLRNIARDYSRQMAQEGFFGHYSPDGESFEDRYVDAGYNCSVPINETHTYRGGENLARSYYDKPVNTTTGMETEYETLEALSEGVVRGWMHSPSHRENILTSEWQREGIGVHVTEDNAVFVTQNFC